MTLQLWSGVSAETHEDKWGEEIKYETTNMEKGPKCKLFLFIARKNIQKAAVSPEAGTLPKTLEATWNLTFKVAKPTSDVYRVLFSANFIQTFQLFTWQLRSSVIDMDNQTIEAQRYLHFNLFIMYCDEEIRSHRNLGAAV